MMSRWPSQIHMFTFFILTKFLPFLSLSNFYLFYPYQMFTFFILIKYLPFLSLSNFYLFHPFIVNFFAFSLQGVQKDINMLNGKLERSFFEISMGMKAKIRNKEPHVEHSMGLLRWFYPFDGIFVVEDSGACCMLTLLDTSWE